MGSRKSDGSGGDIVRRPMRARNAARSDRRRAQKFPPIGSTPNRHPYHRPTRESGYPRTCLAHNACLTRKEPGLPPAREWRAKSCLTLSSSYPRKRVSTYLPRPQRLPHPQRALDSRLRGSDEQNLASPSYLHTRESGYPHTYLAMNGPSRLPAGICLKLW